MSHQDQTKWQNDDQARIKGKPLLFFKVHKMSMLFLKSDHSSNLCSSASTSTEQPQNNSKCHQHLNSEILANPKTDTWVLVKLMSD